MSEIEKKVDEMAATIASSLESGSINSLMVEYIKHLESELMSARSSKEKETDKQ